MTIPVGASLRTGTLLGLGTPFPQPALSVSVREGLGCRGLCLLATRLSVPAGPLRRARACDSEGSGRTGGFSGGWGRCCYRDWAGPGRAGLGWAGEEGEAHLGSSWGAPLSGSGPALTPFFSSRWRQLRLRLCCYLWGRDGEGRWRHQLPPHPPSSWEGEEERGRDTAWEGAIDLGEEGGLEVAQRLDLHRHNDTHLPLHTTPTASITEMHTHPLRGVMEMRTHNPQAHTYLDTHRRQHINSL